MNSNPGVRRTAEGLLAGRVELCLNEVFRTVCDDFWTQQEASLLCQELGYSPYG